MVQIVIFRKLHILSLNVNKHIVSLNIERVSLCY